jgi:hypothetical protein
MAKRRPLKAVDKALQAALRKAYSERARLFVRGVQQRDVKSLIQYLESLSGDFEWPKRQLGITEEAFLKVKRAGVAPHLVFCHPSVLEAKRETLDYYRNLAALSKKGLNQIATGLSREARTSAVVLFLNEIICSIIDEIDHFDLAVARAVIPAEIGAELQGTWVNIIGSGAAKRVREFITVFAQQNNLQQSVETVKIRKASRTVLTLTNGWTIEFGDEPDIAIRNSRRLLVVAIEIKGSMDKAGAQTRYGEAKKSFGKALKENAQCDTIYLASCFTDAVNAQIREDAQVRKVFNLIDILADEPRKKQFLEELFKHQIRII